LIFIGEFRCCNGTFTNALYLHKDKFRYLNSAFTALYFLKFSFQLANICRSYEENKTDSFFRSRCIFHGSGTKLQGSGILNVGPCVARERCLTTSGVLVYEITRKSTIPRQRRTSH